jgi:hypothetical protein
LSGARSAASAAPGFSQATLPFGGAPLSADDLRGLLEARSGRAIELVITRNTHRFVSFRPAGRRMAVRLQEAFLGAPDAVLAALARWIAAGGGHPPREVRGFVNAAAARFESPAPRRPARIRTVGRCHDLAAVAAKANREFFGGAIRAPITWGRLGRPARRVRLRRLGSYNRRRDLITINPVLDRAEVPAFFLAFVVYHEMLHAVQPADTRRWHDRAFHAAEKRHPDYARARAWEKKNLGLILRPNR